MKKINVFLKLLLVFSFLLPSGIYAENGEDATHLPIITEDDLISDEVITDEGFEVAINPAYASEVTENDLAAYREAALEQMKTGEIAEINATTYKSASSLAAYMREQMINRKTTISFKINISSGDFKGKKGDSLWKQLVANAMVETTSPVAGDYLCYNTYSYSVKWSSTSTAITFTYSFRYLSTPEQEKEIDTEIARLRKELNLSGKALDYKATKIYDYITRNVEYDYEHLEDSSYLIKHATYSAVISHYTVCQGYATMYYRLCKEEGVPVRVMVSDTHAWNIVGFGGSYYFTDSTWDAGSTPSNYKWYLKCENNFPDHPRGKGMNCDYASTAFKNAYPIASSDYAYPESAKVALQGFELSSKAKIVKVNETYYFEYAPIPVDAYQFDVAVSFIDYDTRPDYAKYNSHYFQIFSSIAQEVEFRIKVNEGQYSEIGKLLVVDDYDYPWYSCGSNVSATFDQQLQILTITGNGAMDDFTEAPWAEYGDYISTVIIGKGVTYIGTNAFNDCPNIKYVTYRGSESDWNNVVVAGGNDDLLSRGISFALAFSVNPASVTVTRGDVVTFNAAAIGSDGISYRWQKKAKGTNQWEDAGVSGSTCSFIIDDNSLNGYSYRCVARDKNANICYSREAVLNYKESSGYAILTDNGELVFFRSYSSYPTFSVGNCVSVHNEKLNGIVFANVEDEIDEVFWDDYRDQIKTVKAVNRVYPASMDEWFANCVSLTEFDGSLFNTSLTASFQNLFAGCVNLKQADLGSFTDENAVSTEGMFTGCKNLKRIRLSSSFKNLPEMPEGYWTREANGLTVTSEELTSGYGSNANVWQGWWVNKYDKAVISGFKYKKSNLTITWGKVADVASYEVYVSINGAAFKKLATVKKTANSYVHKKIKTGYVYYYYIRTVYPDGYAMNGDVRGYIYSKAPTIKVASRDYDQLAITLSKKSAGYSKYEVYRSNSKSGVYTLLGTFDSTTFIDDTVLTGTTYYYKVRGLYEDPVRGITLNGPYSAVVSGKSALKKPAISSAVQSQYNAVTVSYGAINGAEKYQILRSTSAKKGYKVIGTSDTLNYVDETVIPGKTYYYQVKAVRNVNGKDVLSAASAYKKIKVSIPAIKALAAVINEDGTVTISWSENKYTVSYQLYYSTNKKKSYKSAGMFETLEGITPVLTKGKTYYFKVRCVVTINGKNYYSGYSNIISKKLPK